MAKQTMLPEEYLAKCRKVPIEKATQPIDGYCFCYKNRWWTVVDGCILFFQKHVPQCNGQEEIARAMQQKFVPDADIQLLPVVFVSYDR